MKTAENKPALGFQSLEDLRALVRAHAELREAAALGLGLPPADPHNVLPHREDAFTEAR